MGKDTHALSTPAQRTALEVLAANDVATIIQRDDGVTPTPVISRAILVYNRDVKITRQTASSSRPRTILLKMAALNTTPPTAVRLTPDVTGWIQDRANELLRARTLA